MSNKRIKSVTTISLYHDQKETFKLLGGSEWLRNIIDASIQNEQKFFNKLQTIIKKTTNIAKNKNSYEAHAYLLKELINMRPL